MCWSDVCSGRWYVTYGVTYDHDYDNYHHYNNDHNIDYDNYDNSLIMKITCQNCEQLVSEYLCNIPYQWRQQIAKAICAMLNEQQSLDCKQVKDCETLTTLSAFSVVGSEICITYTDENGNLTERCFDWEDLVCPLDGTDPKCITDQETWDAMTCKEKMQAIIDFVCDDCESITTTTTIA